MRLRTTIVQGDKTATGIRVPDEVIAALGPGRRPPVRVTVNGCTYRTTVASMKGAFMFSLSADVRKNAGVAGGDEVDVDIGLDNEPREVAVPADLQAALGADPETVASFDSSESARETPGFSRGEVRACSTRCVGSPHIV